MIYFCFSIINSLSKEYSAFAGYSFLIKEHKLL